MSENNEIAPIPSAITEQIPLPANMQCQLPRFRNNCNFNRGTQVQNPRMFCQPTHRVPMNYAMPMFQQGPDPFFNQGYIPNTFFNCPPPPIPCANIPILAPNIRIPPPPLPQGIQQTMPILMNATPSHPIQIARVFPRYPNIRQPFNPRMNCPRPFRPRILANQRFRGRCPTVQNNINPRFNNNRMPCNRFINNSPSIASSVQAPSEETVANSEDERKQVDLLYQSTSEKNRIIDERQHPSNGFSGSKVNLPTPRGGRLFLDSSSSSDGEDDDEVIAVSYPGRWRKKVIEFDTSPVSSEYEDKSDEEGSVISSSEDSQASYFSSTRSDITNSSEYSTSTYGSGSLPDLTSSSDDDTPLVIIPDPYYR